MKNQDSIFCSSCNKKDSPDSEDSFVLISKDHNHYWCKDCVNMAHEAIKDDLMNDPQLKTHDFKMLMPDQIFEDLNKHIVGQTRAKKDISVAIAQHLRRLKNPSIKKSNILIMGPTGTGKTEIARTVSKLLNIPFVMTEATNLTTRGYAGEDVESIIHKLLSSVDYNTLLAAQGIVFIDEIDKLARSQNTESGVNTVSVQQELLKIIEGSNVLIKKKNNIGLVEEYTVNTSNILFICAGAFEGLVNKEPETVIGLGISQLKEIINQNQEIENKDLVKYGLIPEFVGRFSVLTRTDILTESDLFKILIEPENSIVKQKQKLFAMDNVDISFSKEYLNQIVKDAVKEKTGARGLYRILESRLNDLYFNINKYKNQEVIISEMGFSVKNNNINIIEEKSVS